MYSLKAGLHQFPPGAFGSTSDLIDSASARERDTLLFACSSQGSAPDNVSFATPGRFSIMQHIGASIPSIAECEEHENLSCDCIEELFNKHRYRHVIVCGHLGSMVIRNWLQPVNKETSDIGAFRMRFERGTRHLVDRHYSPVNTEERCSLMICEHVLVQVENLLTHPFMRRRVKAADTACHAWVIDDDTARVFSYSPDDSAFMPI